MARTSSTATVVSSERRFHFRMLSTVGSSTSDRGVALACAAPLPAPAPSAELPGMNKKDRHRAEYLARKASRPDLMVNSDQNNCGPSTGPGRVEDEAEDAKEG